MLNLRVVAGEIKMTKKGSDCRKSCPLSEREKEEKAPSLEIVISVAESPMELRKREASKPLYLTRYE